MIDPTILNDLKTIRDKFDTNSFKEKRILVTGGAGFIGSWLLDALTQSGANVTCIDNLSTGKLENIDHLIREQKIKLVKKDIAKYKPTKDQKHDLILHLASRPSPEEYQLHPIQTLLTNSTGSQRMLEQARLNDAKILYASTSEVYGDAAVIPTPETYWGNVNPTGPRSCYDEGKRYGEALFTAYQKEYGLKISITRIFNTYGPRIRADGAYARALPRFITQALQNKDITVHGDGTQTRSFCYITDTLLGVLLAATKKEAQGQTINIGNPDEITILTLAKTIQKTTNSKSKIVFKPLPPDDPKRRCPNIEKARNLLGWKPTTTLEEGLEKTINWFKRTL